MLRRPHSHSLDLKQALPGFQSLTSSGAGAEVPALQRAGLHSAFCREQNVPSPGKSEDGKGSLKIWPTKIWVLGWEWVREQKGTGLAGLRSVGYLPQLFFFFFAPRVLFFSLLIP